MRYRISILMVSLMIGAAWAAEVSIAPDRMLEVNGKRTFVIGLYENPQEDAVLDEVAQAGFNLVHAPRDKAALDRLNARGLFAWINTGGSIDLGKDGSGSDAPLREMVEAWSKHAALLVWEVPDEALWNCWLDALNKPVPLNEQYKVFRTLVSERSTGFIAGYNALKKIDPSRPVWMNHAALNSIEDLATFNKAADIVGCDEYPLYPYPTPVFDVSRKALGTVGYTTERMQAAAPEKPVWMVLQGAGWVDFDGLFGKKDPDGQHPDFRESRLMAYDAIVRGARAILYWGTHFIPKDGPLWKDLTKVTRELADLQNVVSAPDASVVPKVKAPALVFAGAQAVRVLGKDVDGQTWWIIVNEYPMPVSYALEGLESMNGNSYTELREEWPAAVNGGVLRGNIAGYGVHILKPAQPK